MNGAGARPDRAGHLVARLAVREARSLTLIPPLEVRVDVPDVQLHVAVRQCSWCTARPGSWHRRDVVLPLREMSLLGSIAAEPGSRPILTILSCEELTARAILILNRIHASGYRPARYATRAVFWSTLTRSPAVTLSVDDVVQRIRRLDEAERWVDDFLDRSTTAATNGAGELPAEGGPSLVLPISSRRSEAATVAAMPDRSPDSRMDRLLESVRSFHFLTPHAPGQLLAELNARYRSVRLAAVREAL